MKIRDRELSIPIIQGGMGVGISLSGLAGAVAACGGMGVISAAHPGYRDPDFYRDPLNVNRRCLKEEIAKAKEIAKGCGLVGVNVMVAVQHYADYVRAAIEGGADAIISGAGLPTELPQIAGDSKVLLAPIVSSGRAARVICRAWERHGNRLPDFVVVEGSRAGGHLGFSAEELADGSAKPLDEIVSDVVETLRPYEEKCGRKIPVFPAGGVYDGADIARLEKLGAAGAQIATRFIATEECDATGLQAGHGGRKGRGCTDHQEPGGHARTGAVQSADPEGGGTGTDRSQPVPAVSAYLQPRRHAVLHHPGAH